MLNYNAQHARLLALPLSENLELLPPTRPDVMLERDFLFDLIESSGPGHSTKDH